MTFLRSYQFTEIFAIDSSSELFEQSNSQITGSIGGKLATLTNGLFSDLHLLAGLSQYRLTVHPFRSHRKRRRSIYKRSNSACVLYFACSVLPLPILIVFFPSVMVSLDASKSSGSNYLLCWFLASSLFIS